MIVIFTRHYLNEDKLICAAELEGMLRRLDARYKIIDPPDKTHIITVVLRSPEKVPDLLTDALWYDFSGYENSSTPIRSNPEYVKYIRRIAQDIADWWDEIQAEKTDFSADHSTFALLDPDQEPDKAELVAFIKKHKKEYIPKKP